MGGNKATGNSCNVVVIYAAITIAIIIISDLLGAWGQTWPKLVILLMALYTLLTPIKPYLGKQRRLVTWLMALVSVLLFLGIIIFFLANNVF
ncbi:MAG: hypothetical protein UT42_C0052G0007 [Candidatus Falkowbacteria bacterium GW2011_GWA2_39_24]|uniref:Uncharacterized protein n=1 Tax=Candidatus Falkowbacteria bacterium GW2011_GWA2_39_24 TaxID=1618634 RepID=A0A0G0NK15_9BACT|nr:MAG: hypothetical protein UT42_C0052G0007 [Candidatus Falkowbacteria bacterium GW2011_GWA2_39_24]